MSDRIIEKLKEINPWHFVWISILLSEVVTLVLTIMQGRIWWGGVSRQTLIIGAVDALVVPLIVASLVLYFITHTTQLEETNEQLQEANRKLQAVDSMKQEIISIVSRDLRAPLTTIKAFAELLIIKPGMAEPQKARLLHTINLEADRLSRLIGDLVQLASMEEGTITWRDEAFSIKDVIQESITGIVPLIEDKGLQVTKAYNPRLPGLRGDRERLVQVVTNILSHAVKCTPPGGAIHIKVREDQEPRPQLVVSISDTGMGIRAGDLDVIFEKFQRVEDDLTSPLEGTALGLALARQIVEHHGGTIRATSTYGKGSIFTFTLPVPSGREEAGHVSVPV